MKAINGNDRNLSCKLEYEGVIGFRLSYVEKQIEIIKEEAIFSRLDILPFAILSTHL